MLQLRRRRLLRRWLCGSTCGSGTVQVRVELARAAPIEPVVRPGAAAHVAREPARRVRRMEREAEGVGVEAVGDRERLRRARDVEVEVALGAVVAEPAAGAAAAGVAVEGAARVGGGGEEGEGVLGVGRVGDERGQAGAGGVDGEAAGRAGVDPRAAGGERVEAIGADGGRGRLWLLLVAAVEVLEVGELQGVGVAGVLDLRVVAQPSHSLSLDGDCSGREHSRPEEEDDNVRERRKRVDFVGGSG